MFSTSPFSNAPGLEHHEDIAKPIVNNSNSFRELRIYLSDHTFSALRLTITPYICHDILPLRPIYVPTANHDIIINSISKFGLWEEVTWIYLVTVCILQPIYPIISILLPFDNCYAHMISAGGGCFQPHFLRSIKLWKSLLFVNSIIMYVTTFNLLTSAACSCRSRYARSVGASLIAYSGFRRRWRSRGWLACLFILWHFQIVLRPAIASFSLSFVLLYEPHVTTYLAISNTGLVQSLHNVLVPN